MDRSPDDFSKQKAVFATEDPTWAIGYALRDPSSPGFLNACLHRHGPEGTPGPREIFLSYARTADGRQSLSPGVVYLVPSAGFVRMSSYEDRALGRVTECQWINTSPVSVVGEIHVTPADLPITPHRHDADQVAERSRRDPLGFPWWD